MPQSHIFLHPFYWISLLVLLINDIILKSAFPGILTGKLSDFAGLIILPLFVFALKPAFFKKRLYKILLLIASGSLLILLQISYILNFLQQLFVQMGLPPHTLTPDITDLIALSILPLVFCFMRDIQFTPIYPQRSPILPILIGFLSFFALTATSYIGTQTIIVNEKVSDVDTVDAFLFEFHDGMIKDDINVLGSFMENDSTVTFSVEFIGNVWSMKHQGNDPYYTTALNGIMKFIIDEQSKTVRLNEIKFISSNTHITDSIAQEIYKSRFIPILEEAKK